LPDGHCRAYTNRIGVAKMNRVMHAEYLASTITHFLASTEVAFSIKTIFAITTAKRIFVLFVMLLLSMVLIAEPIPKPRARTRQDVALLRASNWEGHQCTRQAQSKRRQ
jgi:hypothetical protein